MFKEIIKNIEMLYDDRIAVSERISINKILKILIVNVLSTELVKIKLQNYYKVLI